MFCPDCTKRRKCRVGADVDVELVLIVAVGQGQFMRSQRDLRQFPSILAHGGCSLAVKAEPGAGIAAIHMDPAAEIADHDGEETVRRDRSFDRRRRPGFA